MGRAIWESDGALAFVLLEAALLPFLALPALFGLDFLVLLSISQRAPARDLRLPPS